MSGWGSLNGNGRTVVRLTLALLTSVVPGSVVAGAGGATWNVPGQISSIQTAIEFADDGDVISIAEGVYTESIDFRGKAITVRGSGQQETILDGAGLERTMVRFETDEEEGSVLENLTIRNAVAEENLGKQQGAGIILISASPTIRNVRFESNHADAAGAAISGFASASLIEDCIFYDNTVGFSGEGGGAIAMQGGVPIIRRCRFVNNNGGFLGGALSLSGTFADVSNSIFVSNRATMGGAVRVSGGIPTFTNCTFAFNEADPSFDTTGSAVRSASSAITTIRNSIIWDNTGVPLASLAGAVTEVVDSTVQGGFDGGLGISEHPPAFRNPTGPDGAIGTLDDDFHLKPASPCIDSGNNLAIAANTGSSDIAGGERIVDGDLDEEEVIDHGAYEFVPVTCATDCHPVNGTAIGNGVVNVDDLFAVLNNFGPLNGPCDVSPVNSDGTVGNGIINIDDLFAVIQTYGTCQQ